METQKVAAQLLVYPAHSAPGLLLIDVSAPLQECLRRLQAQAIRVAAAAAHQSDTHPTAPTVSTLLADHRAAAAAVPKLNPAVASHGLDERHALHHMRRRIALKLRQLRTTQHLDLCASTACASDVEVTAAQQEAPSTSTAPPATTAGSTPTWRSGSSGRTPGRLSRPPPLTAVLWDSGSATPAGGTDDAADDVFGWVTQPASESPERPSTLALRQGDTAQPPASPIAVPPPPQPAPLRHTSHGGRADTDDGAVEPLLRRAAVDIADAVECEQRWAATVEDVLQQLRSLESSVMGLVAEEHDAAANAVGPRLRRLVSFTPTHTIATAEELGLWQRAWRAAAGTGAAGLTVPGLEVGASVELLDVAMLARDNARRYTALRQRWSAVRHAYETRVTQLNRQLAMAVLQLDEMESMPKRP